MPWERVAFFRTVEVDAYASGNVTLQLFTDLPGDAMASRETKTLPATTGAARRVYKFHLSGNTKGRLFRLQLTAAGVVRLFGVRIYARSIGGDWGWFSLPVEDTADTWNESPLPIEPLPAEWTSTPLPIEPLPAEWTNTALPIDPTATEFEPAALPIAPTPDLYTWVKAPGAL